MESQIKSTCCHGVVVVLVSWLFDRKLSDQGMGLRLAVKKERKLEGLKFRFGKNKNRKKNPPACISIYTDTHFNFV